MTRDARQIPPHMIRKLTAEECLDKARECRERLDVCYDSAMRRYLAREIKGWLALARERG